VARFGGDEFLILYREACPGDDAAIRTRIREALTGLEVSASVGTAYATGPAAEPVARAAELIQTADTAMYAVKRARQRGRVLNEAKPAMAAWLPIDVDPGRPSLTA
jgi:diguanylate cyclase (GGDEF)-like protein